MRRMRRLGAGGVGRRDFLRLVAAAGAAGTLAGSARPHALAQETQPLHPADLVDRVFKTILDGFVRSARATSTGASYAVCDFPGGTKLKGCCTPSGKTYVSVARMLPPIAELCRRPGLD